MSEPEEPTLRDRMGRGRLRWTDLHPGDPQAVALREARIDAWEKGRLAGRREAQGHRIESNPYLTRE